ncbi:MAG: hypothetical protein P8M68_06340 [Aquiluna sp.]|nr:hypothetical protein [Aquiluna sp.]
MSSEDVDAYLAELEPAKRDGLGRLRSKLLELAPTATEGISYAMPAIIENRKVIAGYAAFKNHLSYFPHSSIVISRLAKDLDSFKTSKGGFQFGIDEVLPDELIRKLVQQKRLLIEEARGEK